MKPVLKATLLASAAWALASLPAFAQDPAPAAPAASTVVDDGEGEEEITVTARRVEERAGKVPASISAFSEKTLERLGATDSTGLQGAVPNLNLVQGRGSSNATNIYIRGIGQPDALQTFDPAVGFYVDDVYYSRIRGTQMDLFDISRVEVLRGPQGTLYGKNTIGGALKIVTRKPDQEKRGFLSATYGSYNQLEAKGGFSAPISDIAAVGFSLLHAQRDGYVTDPVLNREYNDKNVTAGRFQLALGREGGNVRFDFSADFASEDQGMTVGQPLNSLTDLFGLPLLALPNPTPEFNWETRTSPGLPNSTKLDTWGLSGVLSYDINDRLTLKSITAYRDLANDDYVDIDATQLEVGDVFVGVEQDQFSQEFQLTYTTEDWTVVGGLFYMDENIISHQEAYADDFVGPILGNPTFLRTIDDDLQTESWAAYINASYNITEALRLSAGIRYTEEEKIYSRSTSTFSSNPLLTANPAFAFTGLTETWTDTSPMVSLDYQVNDDVMVYARYAKGFKSGGFNGRANNPGEQAPYDPETADSYEAGVKARLWGGKARTALTFFYNDYQDFQARVSGTVTDPGTNLPSPELTVINAGSLVTKGIEFELYVTPVAGLQLDTQIGYLDADYEEFSDVRFPGGDRSFQTPPFSPKWTARFGAQYTWDLGSDAGSLSLGASARYRSRMALAVDNTSIGSEATAVEIAGLFQDDYWLYDARLVWEDNSGRYSAGIYGKNLSDELYKTDGQEFSSVGSIRTVYFGAPQTWSLTLTARY
ncbi:MAG: TonB-dependent receptor [Micropepsaceae bacterium]